MKRKTFDNYDYEEAFPVELDRDIQKKARKNFEKEHPLQVPDYEEQWKEQQEKLKEWELERLLKEGKVESLYRTTTTKAKNLQSGSELLEAQIYPSFCNKADVPHTKKGRESKPSQKNLNDKNSRRYFIRLANINFGENDLWCTFTWDKEHIDGEYGAKLYCLAPKLEQADLAYDAFYQIVQQDEELSEISKKRRSDIYIQEFNTTIKKIAFNSKKSDGFNPHFVLNDEMEAWPGDQGLKQYDVMASALGARKQPLILSTSTAGYENDGIYDELMKRSTAFLKGRGKGDTEKRLLPFLFIIDDVEKWDTREELEKSNPNLGVSVSWEYYEDKIAVAKKSLAAKAEFLTKFCNIKQNSSIAWLDYVDVERAAGQRFTLEDFRGCYCVAGIDLSRTTDLTAASLIIEKDGKNYVITKFFMPRERFKVAINEENVPYNIFEQQGFLKISGEHQVDYKDVFNWFIELVKVYKIKPLKVGYDRYCAGYLVQEMKEAGFHMDDVYQGTNLTPVLHTFEGDLKDGAYCLGENNLLRAHLLNVAVDININDSRMKPVKLEKRAHIDGAVSIFDALAVKMKFHKEIGKQLTNAA